MSRGTSFWEGKCASRLTADKREARKKWLKGKVSLAHNAWNVLRPRRKIEKSKRAHSRRRHHIFVSRNHFFRFSETAAGCLRLKGEDMLASAIGMQLRSLLRKTEKDESGSAACSLTADCHLRHSSFLPSYPYSMLACCTSSVCSLYVCCCCCPFCRTSSDRKQHFEQPEECWWWRSWLPRMQSFVSLRGLCEFMGCWMQVYKRGIKRRCKGYVGSLETLLVSARTLLVRRDRWLEIGAAFRVHANKYRREMCTIWILNVPHAKSVLHFCVNGQAESLALG